MCVYMCVCRVCMRVRADAFSLNLQHDVSASVLVGGDWKWERVQRGGGMGVARVFR